MGTPSSPADRAAIFDAITAAEKLLASGQYSEVDVQTGATTVILPLDPIATITHFRLTSGGTHGNENVVLPNTPVQDRVKSFGRVVIVETVKMTHNDDSPNLCLVDDSGTNAIARLWPKGGALYELLTGLAGPAKSATLDYVGAILILQQQGDGTWAVIDDLFNTDSTYQYHGVDLYVNSLAIVGVDFAGGGSFGVTGLPHADPHSLGSVYVDAATHTLKESQG